MAEAISQASPFGESNAGHVLAGFVIGQERQCVLRADHRGPRQNHLIIDSALRGETPFLPVRGRQRRQDYVGIGSRVCRENKAGVERRDVVRKGR